MAVNDAGIEGEHDGVDDGNDYFLSKISRIRTFSVSFGENLMGINQNELYCTSVIWQQFYLSFHIRIFIS